MRIADATLNGQPPVSRVTPVNNLMGKNS